MAGTYRSEIVGDVQRLFGQSTLMDNTQKCFPGMPLVCNIVSGFGRALYSVYPEASLCSALSRSAVWFHPKVGLARNQGCQEDGSSTSEIDNLNCGSSARYWVAPSQSVQPNV